MMKKEKELKEELNKKLNPSRISKHPHNGFDYVESWDVINTANQIFGHMNWTSRIVDMRELVKYKTESYGKEVFNVGFMCTVEVTVTYRSDDGEVLETKHQGSAIGSGHLKSQADSYDMAVKAAESNAEKRALRKFGYQFGLALYDDERAHVGEDGPEYSKDAVDLNDDVGDDVIDKLSALLNSWSESIYTIEDIDIIPFTKTNGASELIEELKSRDDGSINIFRNMYSSKIKELKKSLKISSNQGVD